MHTIFEKITYTTTEIDSWKYIVRIDIIMEESYGRIS